VQKLLYAEHYLLTHDVLPIAAKELTVGSFVFRVKPQQRSDDPMERQMAQALKRLKARCGKPRVAGAAQHHPELPAWGSWTDIARNE